MSLDQPFIVLDFVKAKTLLTRREREFYHAYKTNGNSIKPIKCRIQINHPCEPLV